MDPDLQQIGLHVAHRLPSFQWDGRGGRLGGGHLNYVWRLSGTPFPVVVKRAPPYVAAAPQVPLDPGRVLMEAGILAALGPDGDLSDVCPPGVRPPRLLDVDAPTWTIILEDLGPLQDLGAWLRCGHAADRMARLVGRCIGRLHRSTGGRTDLAERFDNAPVQRARHEIQYRAVRSMGERAGRGDAMALGAAAEALGIRLQGHGSCLVMGDLWPPSILVAPPAIRIIDWELAHYGNPAQDVAHLAAHLWMLRQRAPTVAVRRNVDSALMAFLTAYRAEAAPLLTSAVRGDCARHFGAEILMRTVGPFQDGSPYEGLPPDSSPVQDAVAVAAAHLLTGESELFCK